MLAPDDRTTFIEQIRPTADAELTHLIGTTFTLDLVSALVPPLAVSGSSGLSSSDPLEIVAALRTTVDTIDVFHQVGQIVVPQTPSRILTLLEPSLHGVRHRPGLLFHPKIWLARYQLDDDTITYRLIVLTRNLTQDKSWDIAVVLDGFTTTHPSAANRPLSKLIDYLPTTAVVPLPETRRRRLAALSAEIRYAEWTPPDGATEVAFHVFGVPHLPARPDFSGRKHLIVSPFLGPNGVHKVTSEAAGEVSIVSTQEAFDQIDDAAVLTGVNRYILAPAAGIPADDDTAATTSILRGLHAKLYCVQRNRRSHVFIGSANATDAAFRGNVEILVELQGGRSIGVDQLLSDASLGQIIVPYDESATSTPDDQEEVQRRLDAYIRHVAAVALTVRMARGDDTCQMHVTSPTALPSSEGVRLTMAPLTRPELAQHVASDAPVSVVFDELPLVDMTALLIVRASDQVQGVHSSTVVKAKVINDLPGRVSAVIGNEIKTPEALIRLLRLLLAFGEESVEDLPAWAQPIGTGGAAARRYMASGLFEMLVRTAARRPDALDNVRRIVEDLITAGDPDHLLPEGFSQMWSAVYRAAHGKEPAHE